MTTTMQNIQDFRKAFGDVMVAVMNTRNMLRGDMNYALNRYGMTAEATTTGITVKPGDYTLPSLGKSVKFDDLSETAQARVLAKALRTLKQQAYTWLVGQVYAGITIDTLKPHLEALGLPQPSMETSISAQVYDTGGTLRSVGFRVSGAVSRKEAKEKLAAVSAGHPAANLAVEAFGDAVVPDSLHPRVTSLSVTPVPSWPSTESITVEGAE
jgi:hypothetical protein